MQGGAELGAGSDGSVNLSKVEKNAEGNAGTRPLRKQYRKSSALKGCHLLKAFCKLDAVPSFFHA